ncbi:hypothetical protein Tco_0198937 [Tanacetum coccineum]
MLPTATTDQASLSRLLRCNSVATAAAVGPTQARPSIQEKDKKKAKNRQNQSTGWKKTKSNQRPKAVKVRKYNPDKVKRQPSEEIQLED